MELNGDVFFHGKRRIFFIVSFFHYPGFQVRGKTHERQAALLPDFYDTSEHPG